MCSRSTQHHTWRELVALCRLTPPAINLQPSYNIAPIRTKNVARISRRALIGQHTGTGNVVLPQYVSIPNCGTFERQGESFRFDLIDGSRS